MSSSPDHLSLEPQALHLGEHEVYVLRVWFERDGAAAVWRASVKPPHEAPRRHFTRPETLLAYLQGRLCPEAADTS